MSEAKLAKYKTVLCIRMQKNGQCKFGPLCDFAHDQSDMRRNFTQSWYLPKLCPAVNKSTTDSDTSEACDGTLASCKWAHNEIEIQYHPHMYKTQMCPLYQSSVGCPRQSYCNFAHHKRELRILDNNMLSKSDNNLNIAAPDSRTVSKVNPSSSQRSPSFVPQTRNQISSSSTSPRSLLLEDDYAAMTHSLKVQMLDIVDQISAVQCCQLSSNFVSQENARIDAALAEHYEEMQRLEQENSQLYCLLEESLSGLKSLFNDHRDIMREKFEFPALNQENSPSHQRELLESRQNFERWSALISRVEFSLQNIKPSSSI